MAQEKWTDEEKELLTEEELAGLEEDHEEDAAGDDDETDDDATASAGDDEDGDKAEATEEAAGEDDAATSDDDADGDDDAAAAEAEKQKTDPDADADGQDDDGDSADQAEQEEQRPAATSDWEAPVGAAERLAAIEAEKDALAEKFDDGEITAKDLREKLKPLEKEERDLDWQMRSSQLMKKNEQKSKAKVWMEDTVPTFLDAHPEYRENKARFDLLDQQVRRMQADADDPTDPKILETAHAHLQDALGAAAKTAKTTDKADRRPSPPPTLADAPSADITETGDGGKFAHLDRLDGEAYEKALAKLTDAEREAYLAS